MTADITVWAFFVPDVYTIYVGLEDSGPGGTFDPSDNQVVSPGADQTFTITANPGYHLVDVLVDNVSVGPVTSYTFTNVQADHYIRAIFENVNDPPVAVDDLLVPTSEETLVNVAVLANDSDAEGDTLAVDSVTDPANGIAVINGTTVDYTPDLNFVGTDTFDYVVSDGQGGTDTGTVTVVVSNVNDPPVAVDDLLVPTSEETLVNVAVLANDSDAEGDTLAVDSVTDPANGIAVINGTTVDYTPDLNFVGTDTFTTWSPTRRAHRHRHRHRGRGNVNDAPVAVDDLPSTGEDTVDNVAAANDSDVDGDALAVVGHPPANGTAATNDGTVDVHAGCAASTAPTPSPTRSQTARAARTPAPSPWSWPRQRRRRWRSTTWRRTRGRPAVDIGVLANDSDADGDPLAVTCGDAAGRRHGGHQLDGTVVHAGSRLHGTNTFDYTVSDGQGGTDTGTVTVVVASSTTPPVAVDDLAATDEDQAGQSSAVLANDSDVDGDTLAVVSVTPPRPTARPHQRGRDGRRTRRMRNFHGTNSFTYTVSDGQGGTDTGTVTVVVERVNDVAGGGRRPAATRMKTRRRHRRAGQRQRRGRRPAGRCLR